MSIHKKLTKLFLNLAQTAAESSTCLELESGAIVARDSMLLALGAQGAPRGCPECADAGCTRLDSCRGVSAVLSALCQCAANGVSSRHSAIYCTHMPSSLDIRALASAQIRRVIYLEESGDAEPHDVARECGVLLVRAEQGE